MTTAAVLIVAWSGTSIASVLLAEATGNEPWWIAAIVVPLAGFSAWLVKWVIEKQDARERVTAEREGRREIREEKRAEQAELQTRAMQQCVIELQTLNQQQQEQARALAELPERVAERIDRRRST